MNTDKILALATRTKTAPKGYDGLFVIKAQAYQLNGNQHPHFSVTGSIGTPRQLRNGDWQAGGCLHEDAARSWPEIKPIIALHLSNADDGEPMHAESNGFYWLAGAVGGLGEQYHGASGPHSKSQDECLRILSDHLRISEDEAKAISDKVAAAYRSVHENATADFNYRSGDKEKAASEVARRIFKDFVNEQRSRWVDEAKAGIDLLKTLSVSG